jgi:2-phospho-L-lactate guanylyltransferase
MTVLVIPVKKLAGAKTRLCPILTESQRAQLVLAVVEDLLAAVQEADVGRIRIVATDDPVCDLARARGACVIREPLPLGHNHAVLSGLRGVQADEAVAVLSGDLPIATTDEIRRFAEPSSSKKPFLRIAPDRHREGTNGLYLSSPGLIATSFGDGSFHRHKMSAVSAGIDYRSISLPGLAHDLDTPEDFRALDLRALSGKTGAFVREHLSSIQYATHIERASHEK